MLLWIAECADCALSHLTPASPAKLVRTFPDSIARDRWRRDHMAATDHWVSALVHQYEPEEFPS